MEQNDFPPELIELREKFDNLAIIPQEVIKELYAQSQQLKAQSQAYAEMAETCCEAATIANHLANKILDGKVTEDQLVALRSMPDEDKALEVVRLVSLQ